MKAAKFADTDAGRIKEGDLCFVFRVFDGIDDSADLLPGRDAGKMLIEMEKRDLPSIPVLRILKEIT